MDRWEVKVTGRVSRQSGSDADRPASEETDAHRQQQNTPKMHHSRRHTHKHSVVC